jgi:hypothetical protein
MNQLFRHIALIVPSVLALSFAAEGRGELITVKFAGTVTSVSVDNDFQSYDFPDVGDPFNGYYRFDSTAPDTANSAGQGTFRTVLPTKAIMVRIGDFQFEGPANVIVTSKFHYVVGDIEPFKLMSDDVLGQILRRNNFTLNVGKENLISDPNTVPISPPSLDGAVERSLRMEMSRPLPGPAVDVIIDASLDSLTVVPEPSILVLVGFALIPLLRTRTRRAQSLQAMI